MTITTMRILAVLVGLKRLLDLGLRWPAMTGLTAPLPPAQVTVRTDGKRIQR
jgi:hypothetical protein